MMFDVSAETVLAVAAVASAISACMSLIVVWRSPIAAAKYAEEIRAQYARQEEIRRQKLYIFSELMKARGVQITRDAVAAFNLIDLVFVDSPQVKDAWAELFSAYNKIPNLHHSIAAEKLMSLLKAVAHDIGIGSDLRSADFERYYYPTALEQEDKAKSIHQRSVISQLGAENDKRGLPALFPPAPGRQS